jgi:aminoglycoside phosphotransferase
MGEDLYRELLDKRPDTEDLVFTHGDYCLPNILIDKWDIGGFIDWGRGGISDGLESIDCSKIEYYRLLDEFF